MVYIGTTIIDVETGIVAISLKKLYYYHNDNINAFASLLSVCVNFHTLNNCLCVCVYVCLCCLFCLCV